MLSRAASVASERDAVNDQSQMSPDGRRRAAMRPLWRLEGGAGLACFASVSPPSATEAGCVVVPIAIADGRPAHFSKQVDARTGPRVVLDERSSSRS